MADVQKQFRQFHDKIQLNNLDENQTLREKRDLLLQKLRSGLAAEFEDSDEGAPTFTERNLGSYAMGTGVKPVNGRDYDIDVGLYFNVTTNQYEPVKLKELVHTQLDKHPHTAEICRPCVTVSYKMEGEDAYHLDFAVCSAKDQNNDNIARLAKGFPGSAADKKIWEKSGSFEFVQMVGNHLLGDDRAQFKRVIRYLKRWKDFQFKPGGEGAPRGIGLTLAAFYWFQSVWQWDGDRNRVDDDLGALKQLVDSMLARFTSRVHEGEFVLRLSTPMPVEPYDDPFGRMSNKQMGICRTKLAALRDGLQVARNTEDLVAACEKLQDLFGGDFPIPEPPPSKSPSGSKGPVIISGGGHFA